ncbi:integrase [Mycobacterium sp. djl-10]|nr:integrase [Mycobacterium sp. djl-10]
MASIRSRQRADGSWGHAVLYSFNGEQTSTTFDGATKDDTAEAEEFRTAVNTIGAEKAMKAWGIGQTIRAAKRSSSLTVHQWLTQYIKTRTGVVKSTIYDYESYLRNDIDEPIGAVPIDLLTRDDVAAWVQGLADRGLSGKTIANRHGFLSAGLNAAVEKGLLESNPAARTRLPAGETTEMVFLDHDEYELMRSGFTKYWWPMLDFMVASGARFGELTALRPGDVNRKRGTVHIGRAWHRTYDDTGYELGGTKTKRSNRTINVDTDVLGELDYSAEWLFVNTRGNPVRGTSFRNNVWYPSIARAKAKGLTKKPRPHDMRHTCASWLIADGQPLPVIQQHLGHESIKTTIDRYGHLDRKSAAAAAAVFGKALRRPVGEGAGLSSAV